nr:uncharacterized protein LOC100174993 [Ciona intestinalis]|eukprot:XP_026690132.1 uncharacterized protein LOC100174993 [Ciona intestinalis]
MDFCMEPSGAHNSKDGRPKHGKTKQAKTGAGKRAVETKQKESNDVKKKFIIIGLAVVALVGGAAGIAVFLMQGSPTICDETSNEDPVTISQCMEQKCEFDISKCSSPCPFGYSTKSEDELCPSSCTCAAHGNFEGDVQIQEDILPEFLDKYGYVDKDDEEFSLFVGSASRYERVLWSSLALPSGRIPVPYKVSQKFNYQQRLRLDHAITTAARWYSQGTCIDLVPFDETKHTKHILIKNKPWCSSYIGFQDRLVSQGMALGPNCHQGYTVAHEFMHALGFAHEQSRPDRDQYVKVHFDNIRTGMEYNFKKLRTYMVRNLNTRYDALSILHYLPRAFSVDGRSPTLTFTGSLLKVLRGGIVTTRTLTPKDLLGLNRLLCTGGRRSDSEVVGPNSQHAYAPAENMQSNAEVTFRNGGLGEWQPWVGCSATCGPTTQKKRVRYCVDSSKDCGEPTYQVKACKRTLCPVVSVRWSGWGDYGQCSVTCGQGMKLRYRTCPTSWKCDGNSMQAHACLLPACQGGSSHTAVVWTDWAPWSTCTHTCDSGYQVRYRSCKRGDSFTSGCPGNRQDIGSCNTHSCSSNYAMNPPSPMFSFESKSVAHLCSGANSDVAFIFGDFNGDRNVDVMCGNQDGDFEIGLATSRGEINTATWRGRLDGCVVQSGQIAVGDFNGDAMSDIVCVDRVKKKTTVRLSNNGQFPTGEGYFGSFCTDESDWLIPLDIDADNKWDLICSHSNRDSDLLMNTFSL